jgi:hypothetical protein
MNVSHTVMLAMTRNSDSVYRVVKLNQNDPPPAGYTSCMPQNLPVFCVVPVTPASGSFDRPTSAYFSPDGSKVYMLNCGPECGGTTSSVSTVNIDPLRIDNFNNVPVTLTTTAVPGGATAAISDGITLYVAGQQYQSANALFTGRLTTLDVNTQTVTGSYSISDGTHTKMLFGQDNSLWIGSQNCASGVRQATHQNYNCLTRFDTTTKTPKVLPVVDPNSSTATVPYPNENLDPYYYGSLTGLCWVQNYGKMYTAYGGQVHIFATADGTEINNSQVTVQGIALDVAYMDATTNSAN